MKLHIVAVGDKMPEWVVAGFETYSKRMPPEARLTLHQIKAEKRSKGKTNQQTLTAEHDRITSALPVGSYNIVLDERGAQISSLALADHMRNWLNTKPDVAFIIGGADGLHDKIVNSANMVMSLSAFTLPHALVRVVIAEQLYRAICILKNHPYHRE